MKPADLRLINKIASDVGNDIAGGFTRTEVISDVPGYERHAILRFERPSRMVPGCVDRLSHNIFITSSTRFEVLPMPILAYPPLERLVRQLPDDLDAIGATKQYVLDDLHTYTGQLFSFTSGIRSSLPVLSGGIYSTGPNLEFSRAAGYADAINDLVRRFPESIAINLFDTLRGPIDIEEECYAGLKKVASWSGDNPVPRGCFWFVLYCDMTGDKTAADRVLAAVANSGLESEFDFAKVRALLTGV